jgi:hypothetical protein
MSGSDSFMAFNIRGTGNRISGRIATPESAMPFQVFRFPYFNTEGAVQVSADLDIFSRGTGGVSPITSLSGGWHAGSEIRMRIHETFDDTTGAPRSPAPALPMLPQWVAPQIPVNLANGVLPQASLNRQEISIDLHSELPFANLIDLVGAPGFGQTVDPAAVMPTLVRLSGRIENVTNVLYRGANSQGPAAGSGALPVRVLCEGLVFRVFNPATSFVGSAATLDNAFEIIKLRGCTTPEGWVSEQDGRFTVTGSGLTGTSPKYFDVQTNLLWRPRQISVAPMNADAASYFRFAQVITTGTGSSENAIRPRLRFHFDGATPSTASLIMGWSAAVAPF